MFISNKTGAFVYLTCIYTFLSVLQSLAQFLLSQAPLRWCMGGVSVLLCRKQSYITCLVTQSSVAKEETVPKSKLFSSRLLGPCFFSIKFPDVLSLPCSSQCQNGSGEEGEKRPNFVAVKAAEWSVCVSKGAGCSRMLQHSVLRGERWEWFPGWRLTAPSSVIEGWGWCECWWPQQCLPLLSEDLSYWFCASTLFTMWCSSGMGDASQSYDTTTENVILKV